MKLGKVLMGMAVIAVLAFAGCKPKDEDILKSVTEKIAAMPAEMKGLTATVKDGVVTLNGVCKDEKCKEDCRKAIDDAKIKGVKSVVSNCTIPPPPPPPPASTSVSSLSAEAQQKIKDGLKDIKGLSSVDFSAKGAVLAGEVTKADNLKIKQILGAAKIAMDAAASKLVIK